MFAGPAGQLLLGKRVLLVSYDGDTARVATSVLRARGVEAESVRGGAAAVAEAAWWPGVRERERDREAGMACFEEKAVDGAAGAAVVMVVEDGVVA